jgi:hypothetical protein
MEKAEVKDAYGTVVGSIETAPDGNQTLRSTSGRVRATYEADGDHTRDGNGNIIAKGNALNRILC